MPISILIVDDVPEYGTMLADLIRASNAWANATIATAESYDQALRAMTATVYDVAIIDYRLGARDGVALLRELRDNDIDTPVIILTGHGAEHVAVNAMKAGAADYLGKVDVSVDAIDRAIRHALALGSEERQRRQAEAALRASERRFRALVENSSDALLLIDGEARVQYVTPSSTRHLGWPAERMVGRSIFDFVHAEDRSTMAARLSDRLATPGDTATFVLRVQHADGTFRMMEVVAVNRFDEPAVDAIVVNARDITKRRLLEDRLQHVQRMEALGHLASSVAHDFNNLLTAMLGYCNLMLEDMSPEDSRRPDLEEIRAAGDRAIALTRQLIAFGHREATRPDADVTTDVDKSEQLHGWETVLIVAEEDAVRALTREVLRHHGYTVLEARHGVDALRLAERHRDDIHLLITTAMLSRMTGRQLADRLVSSRPDMKVLFLAGLKPLTPDALARKVRRLLDEHLRVVRP